MSEILVITGPTASGKTARAMQLAEADSAIEIINVDVQLFYRGFDIGTAKPTLEERSRVPHHFIDTHNPDERPNAADFSRHARKTISELVSQGKKPIVVGGTGLYIDALFEGLIQVDVSPDAEKAARERVEREYEEMGFEQYHEALKPVDPVLHHQIAREQNPIRLLRAWEHYYATGQPLGEARKEKPVPFEHRPRYEVLEVPRPELWKRIEERTDRMLETGWVEEVKQLIESGVKPEMPGMKAIGYRELAAHLKGELALDVAREQIVIRTRQYAKRQTTWMKRYNG